MSRFTAAVLCALAALPVAAAPAPTPRPWLTGWDEPVDPHRDCLFHRHGEALTLTVPGRRQLVGPDWRGSPRLLRDAEGDFDAEVRLSGCFQGVPSPAGGDGVTFQTAGLLILAEDGTFTQLERVVSLPARDGKESCGCWLGHPQGRARADA